jgi:hypothetical protein
MESTGLQKRIAEELKPFVIEMIRAELAKFVKSYEAELDRADSGVYTRVKEACRSLGVSRQTLYNWENGPYDIGSFVKLQGRYKLYDVESIKAKLAKLQVLNARLGQKTHLISSVPEGI